MNMIIYVGGSGFSERGQKICTGLILYEQLEIFQKIHGNRIKFDKGVMRQLNIPFGCCTYKHSMENS
jgi:hypothetical protein